MDDYRDMYPKKPDDSSKPDPRTDPIGAFPENPDWSGVREAAQSVTEPSGTSGQEQPEPPKPQEQPQPEPRPEPDTGVFYGDPSATTGKVPDYGWQVPPVVEQEKPVTMNRRIYTMSAVIAVLIFLLCVYCIGSDVLHGALGTALNEPVRVELQTQEKPELDLNAENVNADGEYTVRGVADLVTPSIVEVYTFNDPAQTEASLSGTGSGIIISGDGYIITNAHVVQGAAFGVILNGTDPEDPLVPAQLIGSDAKTDLAVLKINQQGLTPAVLGNSDQTYVGENVVAIGNPAGLTNTVTKGIVSAIGRQMRSDRNNFRMECIQTDAAISPGNSGGALVNMYGQVIGITSSKYASMYTSTYEGLGFAITINQALPIVTELIENGYVSGRFRIGITLAAAGSQIVQEEFEQQNGYPIPTELQGAILITEVAEDCDISNTELKTGDFIVEMQGKQVGKYDDVLDALDGCKGGDTVTAKCARIENGRVRYFDITFQLEEDTSGNF